MPTALIFPGIILGGLLGLVIYSLVTMAQMSERNMDNFEYQLLLQAAEKAAQPK
ncbi:MAG: hypothetical protein WC643_00090 [Parcubacteria group bacterium]|jgi:hypothetical protein